MTELMIACSLSAIILVAILAAYLYIGRNLTRLVNLQEQEVQSRRALRLFTSDVSAAIEVTTATTSVLTLTKPVASGNSSIAYAYASGNGTLTRTESGNVQTVLSGLTSFSLIYYNDGGTTITSSPQSVKAVEFACATAAGSSPNGTRVAYTTVSPRVVLRNKAALK